MLTLVLTLHLVALKQCQPPNRPREPPQQSLAASHALSGDQRQPGLGGCDVVRRVPGHGEEMELYEPSPFCFS